MFIIGIIILTIALSVVGFEQRAQFERMMFLPARILGAHEYYRMITSAFVHVSYMHLFFNMFSLYLFGEMLEQAYGAAALGALYLISILGGSAFSLLIHRHDPAYSAVGASGGVCGVIFASLFLTPYSEISLLFIPIWIPDWAYAFIFLAASLAGIRYRMGNIGHDAHFGGAITGMLAALFLFPEMVWQRLWLFAALLAATAFLGYFCLREVLSLPAIPRIRASSREASSPTEQATQPVREKSNRPPSGNIDTLLERISTKGIDSLTPSEKETLQLHAKKLQTRRNP